MKTIFLEGDPRYRHVSSTLVRQICARRKEAIERSEEYNADINDELSHLVPERVVAKVADVYGAKYK